MGKELILNGIRLGEYDFDPKAIYKKLDEECIATGMNYVKISAGTYRPDGEFGEKDREFFVGLAKYLADHEIYFDLSFLHHNKLPLGVDQQTYEQMRQVAGKYYRAHSLSELGTKFGCAASGYGAISGKPNEAKDMGTAMESFVEYVRDINERGSMHGEVPTFCVDATMLLAYSSFMDLSIVGMELVCGNPELMLPLERACARATGKDADWGTYVAHEWYAGTKTLDTLKQKRLKMYYDHAYMNGSHWFVLESGDECLYCHDTAGDKRPGAGIDDYANGESVYGHDHPVSQHYRNVLADFAQFVKKDHRPDGGPKVKVAFVYGNLDGYSAWRAGSSLWNCFDNKEFGYSTPEYVWRIMDDISTKRHWADVHNFGEVDLSGAPAYGSYDIVPAWAGHKAFSRYDYLIFTGWNTMTEEIYEELKQYVHDGGTVFMTAAHLNTTKKRNGEIKLVHDGKISELFGCELDSENAICVNDGIKFHESIVPGIKYPASFSYDPLLSEGYANYAKAKVTGGKASALLSHSFNDLDESIMDVGIVENQYGKGHTILMTTLDYPSGATYPVYRTVVREIITASHRAAEVKVYGGDKLRFSVYEGNKIYLLNTDFDCVTQAVIDYGDRKKTFLLEPMELRAVEPDEV